jgi:hypothetical protein
MRETSSWKNVSEYSSPSVSPSSLHRRTIRGGSRQKRGVRRGDYKIIITVCNQTVSNTTVNLEHSTLTVSMESQVTITTAITTLVLKVSS